MTRLSDPGTALVWTLATGSVVGIGLWAGTEATLSVPSLATLMPALAAGPFYLLGNLAYFRAIRRGNLAVVAPLVGREGGIAALALLLAWRPGRVRGFALPRPALPAALVLGSLDVVAFSLLAAAAATGPIAIASVSGAQFATFAALLGLLVPRKRLAVRQYAGVAMTLAAVSTLAATA